MGDLVFSTVFIKSDKTEPVKLNAAAPALLTIFLLMVFCFSTPTLAGSTAPTASIELADEPVKSAASLSAGSPAGPVHENSHQKSTRSDPYSIVAAARQRHRLGLQPRAQAQLPISIARLRYQLDAAFTDQPERLQSSLEQRAIALKSSTQRQISEKTAPIQSHTEQLKIDLKVRLRNFIQRLEAALHSTAEALR